MLKVENLSFSFAHLPLFSGISLEIKAGEILHITGANGVGKSTLMQILAGIIQPRSGTVTVRIGEQTVEDRRLACEYLPSEGNGLFLRRDAIANLTYWRPLRGEYLTREQAHDELARWGLTNAYFREGFPVGKFSTGMKRRLSLARVTTSNSPIWLLDEPIYGLDQSAIAIFRQRLDEHLKSLGAVAIISHDLSLFTGQSLQTFSLSTSSVGSAGRQ